MFFVFIDHVPVMSSIYIRKLVPAGFNYLEKIFFTPFLLPFAPN
jgi:hypothetical protein